MASTYYREVEFKSAGPRRHLEIERRIHDLDKVDVLLTRYRKLGFLERDHLFRDAFQCHLVLRIGERHTEIRNAEGGSVQGPYRRSSDDVITVVRPDLAEIFHELSATHAEVTRGLIRFESRTYKKDLVLRFREEFREVCDQHHCKRELQSSAYGIAAAGLQRLHGRVEGAPESVDAVAYHLRGSGYIDPNDVVVDYV